MTDAAPVVPAILAAFVVAAFSVFCIAKPDKIAAYARRRYSRSSKFTQGFPFANMVLEGWYPTCLRVMGVVGLLFAFGLCYAAIKSSGQ